MLTESTAEEDMESRRVAIPCRSGSSSAMAFTFGSSGAALPAFSPIAAGQASSVSEKTVFTNFKFNENFLNSSSKCKVGIRFQWRLDNIGQGSNYVSNMIEIHGQKMFRVALRNQSPSTLMFCSIHHRKIGLKIVAVSFWTDVNGVIQNLALKGSRGDTGFLFFSKSIPNYFGGTCTFSFEVQVGALTEAFYYNLDDKLMRDQLWKAAQNKLFTDMEFIVKKKSFAAHKVVVSARSPVFAAMFNNDMLESKTNQVKINDVDPSCFERFLEFIYTGKINGAADDENLMKVADKYQIDTLKNVCLSANQEITPEELTSLMISLQPDLLIQPTVVNRSLSQGDVTVLPEAVVIELLWNVGSQTVPEGLTQSMVFEFRNEKLFRAGLDKRGNAITLTFVSTHHQRLGYKILEVLYSVKPSEQQRMKFRTQAEDQPIQMFTASQLPPALPGSSISFYVHVVETIKNYSSQLADTQLSDHLWSVSQNKELTDIEIVTYDFVGKKTFAAHKAILAARSPVFASMFSTEKPDSPIKQLEVPDIEASVFAHFLSFLYTGRLKTSANNKKLLLAAEKYQVETLKNICEQATQETDIDKLTSAVMFL